MVHFGSAFCRASIWVWVKGLSPRDRNCKLVNEERGVMSLIWLFARFDISKLVIAASGVISLILQPTISKTVRLVINFKGAKLLRAYPTITIPS